jgi:hypothetical protein
MAIVMCGLVLKHTKAEVDGVLLPPPLREYSQLISLAFALSMTIVQCYPQLAPTLADDLSVITYIPVSWGLMYSLLVG